MDLATAKITVKLSRNSEGGGTNEGMLEALAALAKLGPFPLDKVTLAISCDPEKIEDIRDEIAVGLTARAGGIDLKISRQIDEDVPRARMVKIHASSSTPMDRAGWDAPSTGYDSDEFDRLVATVPIDRED